MKKSISSLTILMRWLCLQVLSACASDSRRRGQKGKLFWRVEHLRQIFSSYEYVSENPQLRRFRLCRGDALIFEVAWKFVYGTDTESDYQRLLQLEPRLRMSDDA